MGKVERLKQERKILKEQQKLVVGNKSYRNRIFVYGLVSGILATSIVFGAVKSLGGGSSAVAPKDFATNSATTSELGAPLAVPSDIQLTLPSPTTGGI